MFNRCEGGNCNEHVNNPFESELERANSVKSNEHMIEILIPSEPTDGFLVDPHSPSMLTSRRQSMLSESDKANNEEQLSATLEDPADDSKPKIILHIPKKKVKNFRGSEQYSTPLSRLSLNELKHLADLSEKDLKDSLLKALEEKNPT